MLGTYQFQPYYPLLQKYLERPRIMYLQPFSSKTEPFTEWQLQPYQFVTNGFCYNKNFAAKISGKTQRSVFKIQQSISQQKGKLQLSNSVRFWFDLPNAGSLFMRLWPNNSFKVIYDHGVYYYKGQYFYLFGGAKANKNFQNVDYRIGLGLVSQNCNSENRLKYHHLADKQQHKFQWFHKTYLAYKRLRFGFMGVVDLNKTVFQKNNLLFGFYFRSGSCAFLRAQVDGWRRQNPNIRRPHTVFDTITADYIHDLTNKSKCAFEVKYNIQQRKIDEAVAVYQLEYETRKKIKASFSNKMNFGILTKLPLYGLQQYAQLSASILFKDIAGKNISYKSGFELNINL